MIFFFDFIIDNCLSRLCYLELIIFNDSVMENTDNKIGLVGSKWKFFYFLF